jgi:hypothetical protein
MYNVYITLLDFSDFLTLINNRKEVVCKRRIYQYKASEENEINRNENESHTQTHEG